MTFIETFKKVYEGDKFMHVKITSIDPQTKKKSATEVKQPINFERHLAEEEISGISPVVSLMTPSTVVAVDSNSHSLAPLTAPRVSEEMKLSAEVQLNE